MYLVLIHYRTSRYYSKLSAESERKALQAQLTTEKMLASDQLAAYEEEIQLLCKEKDEFEIEKRSLFVEKASSCTFVSRYILLNIITLIHPTYTGETCK